MTVTLDKELTAQDRCDYCSARAKVVATFMAGELLFCGHCARHAGKALLDQALNVWDPDKELKLF